MAVDFTISSLFNRTGVLITDDAIITLEHDRSKDRMRKILLEHVDSVISWNVLPWGRMLAVFLVFMAGGVPFFFLPDPGTYFAAGFLSIGLVLELRYLHNGKTFIRVTALETSRDFMLIARPSRIERILSMIYDNTLATQDAALRRAEDRMDADRSGSEMAAS